MWIKTYFIIDCSILAKFPLLKTRISGIVCLPMSQPSARDKHDSDMTVANLPYCRLTQISFYIMTVKLCFCPYKI